MKQFILLFFILTPFTLLAQTFEWGQSYGLGSGNTSYDDNVTVIEFDEEPNITVVGGYYYSSTDVEIGGNETILEQESEEASQGFIAGYTSSNDLLFAFNLGRSISDIELLNDSLVLVSGSFSGSFDFDPREDSEMILEGTGSSQDGFIACYNTNGTPVWVKHFATTNTGGISQITFQNESLLVGGTFIGNSIFDPNDQNLSLPDNQEGSAFIMELSLSTAEVTWHHIYDGEGLQAVIDLEYYEASDFIGVNLITYETEGLDIGISSSLEIESIDSRSSNLLVYSASDLELLGYFQLFFQESISVTQLDINQFGEIHVLVNTSDASLSFRDFQGIDRILDFSNGNVGHNYLIKFNRNQEIVWIKGFSYTETENTELYDIAFDSYSNAYVYGDFPEQMFIEGSFFSGQSQNNFVSKFDLIGNLNSTSILEIDDGDIEGEGLSIDPQNNLYLIGAYGSNPNFTFTTESTTMTLGSNAGEEGFFCKYNLGELAEQEAQVYLQTPYFDSIPEGVTLNSHIFISKLPTETVEVTLTPDDQLDLGNGQGEQVIFTFDNSELLSDQMFDVPITALDDEAVEDEFHSGIIQIEVSSADAEFDAIESFSEELILIDDDVDSVDERNKDSQISVYP
ncbi:hypothetical protein, partial [Halocola ammonii]